MRRLAVIAAAVMLLFATGCGRDRVPTGRLAIGRPAPDFSLRDLSGKTHRLSDYRGKVVMINFWATWCPPCRAELGSMQRLFAAPPGNDFRMLTILVNDSPANGAMMARKKGYTFPILMDPEGTTGQAYGITGVPETYIVDRNGILREKVIGADDWNSPRARDLIRSILRLR